MAERSFSRPASLRQHPAGFTIVELLVVIAIMATLISILVPAVMTVRTLAQRTACLNNLREIGLTTQVYVTTRDSYPAAWTYGASGEVRWMDRLKSYVPKSCAVYCCPCDPKKIPSPYDPSIILSYGINSFNFGGNAHCFWYPVAAYDVAHTNAVILFADCTPGNYWCGGGNTFSDPVPGVDYRHLNGTFNAVYCDGHAESRTTTTQRDWDAAQ